MAVKSRVATHLWFDTQALEAATHYVSLLPNSRIVSVLKFGQGGPEPDGSFLSVTFELDGQKFMALNAGPVFQLTEVVSIFVSCDTQAEIDRLWNALLEGGGSEQQCGWLKDRFGLSWQIVPSRFEELSRENDPVRMKRAMDAVMGMVKLDIAAIERAYDS